LQDGFWGVKILLLLGFIVGSFFIPNPFFEYYGWVALGASSLFIMVQLILLVDFAHSWAEKWIDRNEACDEEDTRWWWLMLTVTIVMFSAALGLTITMYIIFHDCTINVAFVTVNLLICFLISIVSIHPKVQESNTTSGLLQPALITTYCTYLIFSAIQSEDSECNPWKAATTASNTSLLIGSLFTICAVCYSTFRASSTIGAVEPEKESLVRDAESGEVNREDEKEETEEHHKEDSDEPIPYSYSKFHIIYALGAMYIAMLMTDWQTVYNPGNSENSPPVVDSGLAAVWVKVVSSWICLGLYIWTLIGPILFPDREWKA